MVDELCSDLKDPYAYILLCVCRNCSVKNYLLIGKYCQTALQKEKIFLSRAYESVLANTEYG